MSLEVQDVKQQPYDQEGECQTLTCMFVIHDDPFSPLRAWRAGNEERDVILGRAQQGVLHSNAAHGLIAKP